MLAWIKSNFYSLLATLDEVTAKVVLSEGEEYQSTTSTLSIAVAQIDIGSNMMLLFLIINKLYMKFQCHA